MQTDPEMRESEAKISWLGRLDGEFPNFNIWNGKISAESARKSSLLEKCKTIIGEYFVKADKKAAIRCIDGRPDETSLEAERQDLAEDGLGAQVPGGSPASGLAYRLANFNRLPNTNTVIDDTAQAMTAYKKADIPFATGMHEDDMAEFPNTGCGAIDKQPQIMDKMVDQEAGPLIKQYTEAVLEEDFDPEVFDAVCRDVEYLNQPEVKERYLMRTGDDRDSRLKAKEEVEARSGEEAIEKMVGDHREIILMINKVEGETFNRDLFCQDLDNEAQAFNYDYWLTLRAANTLYTDDPEARSRLLTSRVMYAVATAMVLTDGSLELGVRK